jgi:pimeloyl-ACP methyl ester carboxylesterase
MENPSKLVFDYGAPIGFRLAIRHPERITAVISQNGNAYLEGLSEGWNPIQTYWKDPSPENRAALRAFPCVLVGESPRDGNERKTLVHQSQLGTPAVRAEAAVRFPSGEIIEL